MIGCHLLPTTMFQQVLRRGYLGLAEGCGPRRRLLHASVRLPLAPSRVPRSSAQAHIPTAEVQARLGNSSLVSYCWGSTDKWLLHARLAGSGRSPWPARRVPPCSGLDHSAPFELGSGLGRADPPVMRCSGTGRPTRCLPPHPSTQISKRQCTCKAVLALWSKVSNGAPRTPPQSAAPVCSVFPAPQDCCKTLTLPSAVSRRPPTAGGDLRTQCGAPETCALLPTAPAGIFPARWRGAWVGWRGRGNVFWRQPAGTARLAGAEAGAGLCAPAEAAARAPARAPRPEAPGAHNASPPSRPCRPLQEYQPDPDPGGLTDPSAARLPPVQSPMTSISMDGSPGEAPAAGAAAPPQPDGLAPFPSAGGPAAVVAAHSVPNGSAAREAVEEASQRAGEQPSQQQQQQQQQQQPEAPAQPSVPGPAAAPAPAAFPGPPAAVKQEHEPAQAGTGTAAEAMPDAGATQGAMAPLAAPIAAAGAAQATAQPVLPAAPAADVAPAPAAAEPAADVAPASAQPDQLAPAVPEPDAAAAEAARRALLASLMSATMSGSGQAALAAARALQQAQQMAPPPAVAAPVAAAPLQAPSYAFQQPQAQYGALQQHPHFAPHQQAQYAPVHPAGGRGGGPWRDADPEAEFMLGALRLAPLLCGPRASLGCTCGPPHTTCCWGSQPFMP